MWSSWAWRKAPPTANVDVLCLSSRNYFEMEVEVYLVLPALLLPPSSKSPMSLVVLPSLPLLPPLPKSASSSALHLLVQISPSVPPLKPLPCVDSPRFFSSPALPSQLDPPALSPAADPITPPRSIACQLFLGFTFPPGSSWLHLRHVSLWFCLGLQDHRCRPVQSALISTQGSTFISIVSVGHPLVSTPKNSTMASPSIDSVMGFHPGCALCPCLAPPAPGFSLVSPTVIPPWSLVPLGSCLSPATHPPSEPPPSLLS